MCTSDGVVGDMCTSDGVVEDMCTSDGVVVDMCTSDLHPPGEIKATLLLQLLSDGNHCSIDYRVTVADPEGVRTPF